METRSVSRSILLSIFVISFLPGCGSDAPGPVPPGEGLTIWLGSYTSVGGDDSGSVMFDIDRDGRRVTAETVIRSRRNERPFEHLYLEGSTDGDIIELSLDTARVDYQFQFDVHITLGSGETMSGSFFHSFYEMTADFDCQELESSEAEVDTFLDMHTVMLGLTFDGEDAWISTAAMDHFLVDSTLVFVDTVAVLLAGGAHWTSDALTAGDSMLYGAYPVTVAGPEGSVNESDIIVFTRDGEVSGRFRVGKRISGLAWSGEDLWSLPVESDSLHRIGPDGVILESFAVDVPDLVDIEFDGEYFWGVGWFMKRLYRISATGGPVKVYHLPGEHGFIFPSALAFDGSRFWYGFNTSYLDSRIYLLNVD